jgi:hypothetical protein
VHNSDIVQATDLAHAQDDRAGPQVCQL